jgi:hypothetical protein
MRLARILVLGVAVGLFSSGGAALAQPGKSSTTKPKASYFLASDPHVPLALVQGATFSSVGGDGRTCGDPGRWARIGSRWRALDAWGQIVGELEMRKTELYPVTGCREATMRRVSGTEGANLFVSADSAFTPRPSARWEPSSKQRGELHTLIGTLAKAMIPDREIAALGEAAFGTTFFTAPADPEVSMVQQARWAIVAGPVFIAARLSDTGWKVMNVKGAVFDLGGSRRDVYRVVSIVDMNGDGVPEIVLRTNSSDWWADSVLSFDRWKGWIDVAESPGGSRA